MEYPRRCHTLPIKNCCGTRKGELSPDAAERIRAHIDSCWMCRVRRQEFEEAIVDFIRAHRQEMDPRIPPFDGARALLTARLAEVSAAGPRSGWLAFFGAARAGRWRSRLAVWRLPLYFWACSAAGHYGRSHPKAVPAELQRKVFEEYGIAGGEPRAYEVDYLVTPALGGADDIRNLWPHSYSATMWNAQVKDALEDRLREMVCEGSLDLMEAQTEIAVNWIAAYKKYFHTGNAPGAALQARNSQLDHPKMKRIHSLTLLCGIAALAGCSRTKPVEQAEPPKKPEPAYFKVDSATAGFSRDAYDSRAGNPLASQST